MSPHLLMRSGIGPAAELARHGIALLHDAPEVGENLADHLDITVMSCTRGREPIGLAPASCRAACGPPGALPPGAWAS
ncbi:GMC family oxidoreductase N-terminal domain-containing protein [Frigidibacter mobilis]